MAFKPTKAQEDAIITKGNVLVSAAAGSGKTAVLVERVMKLMTDEENPVSADRMLIVTFTNAAAAEMRARIEKRMETEFKNNPGNRSLIRQRYLLANAKICTIDSFCIDLVRENFEKLGVNPDFKMSDSGTLSQIDTRVIGEIVNEHICKQDKVFLRLLDIVGAEYDEQNFISKVLEIYNYSRQLAEPTEWFDSLKEPYLAESFTEENPWYKYAVSTADNTFSSLRNLLAVVIDGIAYNEKAANKFLPTLMLVSQMLAEMHKLCGDAQWDELYEKINDFVLPHKPDARGFSGIRSVSAVKTFFDTAQKEIDALKRFFYGTKSQISAQIEFLREPVILFAEILKEYDKRLFEAYLQENTFTFHNTEHLALKLLSEVDENGENEFLNRYDVVMVDEYQDTNNLQDRLFYVLSANEKKLFAVGDIKQSIYGFRGANPDNFLKKKNRYIPLAEATNEDPKKIILSNNFRSNSEICSFVNYFFSLFMTAENSGLDYGEEEMLISSSSFPKSDTAVELRLTDASKSDKPAIDGEALAILDYINSVMMSGECINGEDGLRKARYSDFAILMRATRYKADKIAAVLRSAGIPVNFSVEGFADRTEIQTILSFLRILDNPKSDIELACVMLSPIYGFSPDELAQIKASKGDGDFYSSVQFSAKCGNEKVIRFLESLEYYRRLSVTNPLPKTVSLLINESGYINMVSAMNEGITRRNNLLLLVKYAQDYEASNVLSISMFVRYIKNQSESGLKAALSDTGSDSVRIMSIHASKGLQFPICIIANTSSEFKSDYNKNCVCYTEEDSIGFRYYDGEASKKITTINYEIMGDKEKRQVRAEELRLFYVAMTRAQERLVFITSVKNLERKKESISEKFFLADNKITAELFSQTSSYADWLLLAAALHPKGGIFREDNGIIANSSDSNLNITVFNEEYANCSVVPQDRKEAEGEIDTVSEKIARNISFEYPYEKLRRIEAKASVSAVANKAESEKYAFSETPAFMSGAGMTATQKGTAMHKIIQFFDFSKANDIKGEIERLCEWKFISETEAENANIKALENFFASDVFSRIISADEVHREMRFLTEVEPRTLDSTIPESNEKVILQGAVDLCFIEDNGIVILDFKTDRVNSKQELIEAYSEQLNYYSLACSKIFSMPVKEKIIYSFALGETITIK